MLHSVKILTDVFGSETCGFNMYFNFMHFNIENIGRICLVNVGLIFFIVVSLRKSNLTVI